METDPLLEGLSQLYSAVVCDILDETGYRHQALPHTIRPLTPTRRIYGRAFTAHASRVDAIPADPYVLEIEAIDSLVAGDIMVTDLEEAMDCGFWGELMTTACLRKGVNGAVFNGCTRDIWKLKELDFPVFAMGYHPADSKGRIDIDAIREPVEIGEVTIHHGDYLLGDEDGCVVIPQAQAPEVIRLAKEKVSGENTARKLLLEGVSLGEVFSRLGIL